MSFVLTKKLPTPMEIKELYPVSAELAALKAAKDQELIDIITGASDKFMVIIGPPIMKKQSATISADLPKFRTRFRTSWCLYRVSIPTNLVQPVKATKVCSISQILRKHLTY